MPDKIQFQIGWAAPEYISIRIAFVVFFFVLIATSLDFFVFGSAFLIILCDENRYYENVCDLVHI